MSPEKLFTTLAAFHALSEDFKKNQLEEIVFLTLAKNHMLLETPRISTHAFYLNEGFALSYSFVDGKERTESFWKPGDAVASFESFFEQKPSLESIQLMQKRKLLFISFESVMSLFKRFPAGTKEGHAVTLQTVTWVLVPFLALSFSRTKIFWRFQTREITCIITHNFSVGQHRKYALLLKYMSRGTRACSLRHVVLFYCS